ncbi:MAG: PAS domain S-box protein, partial [Gemmataceae bacterium]
NDRFCQITGYTREELLGGMRMQQITHPEDLPGNLLKWNQMLREGKPFEIEKRYIRKDGSMVWVHNHVSAIRDSSGHVLRQLAVCIDITERKKAELALRESESNFRSMFDNLSVGMAQVDHQAKFMRVNQRFCELTGYTEAELTSGMGPADLDHLDDREVDRERLAAFFKGEVPHYEVEKRYLRKDKSIIWVRVTAKPIFDDAGKITATAGIIEDINLRRESEQALRESEERFRTIFNHAATGIVIADWKGRIQFSNPAFCQMLGYTEDELRHLPIPPQIIHSDDRVENLEQVILLRAGKIPFLEIENRYVHKTGRPVWVRKYISLLPNATKEHADLVTLVTDVTARRDFEQALSDREAHLKALMRSAADAILTVDPEGRIQTANPATERIFGWESDELIGRSVHSLMGSSFHDEMSEFHDALNWKNPTAKIGRNMEMVGRPKSGPEFPVEVSVNLVNAGPNSLCIVRDIRWRRKLEQDVVEVASLEQQRIGQDLHDTVCQELTALGIQASGLIDVFRKDPKNLPSLVEKLVMNLRRGQMSLRHIMQGLLPVTVNAEGLMAALKELAASTAYNYKISCQFVCPQPITIDDSQVATHLFLIAQEAVHNSIKHADGKNIRIRLESNGLLSLSVEDDG